MSRCSLLLVVEDTVDLFLIKLIALKSKPMFVNLLIEMSRFNESEALDKSNKARATKFIKILPNYFGKLNEGLGCWNVSFR